MDPELYDEAMVEIEIGDGPATTIELDDEPAVEAQLGDGQG
jgi:hypothetical protein